MKIAIIGTRGIPNNYGGFEALAEYLAINLSALDDITVFCSSKDLDSTLQEYNGAKLRYINVSSHGAWGVLYDSISLIKATHSFDKVLILGFGCGFLISLFDRYRDKFIVNIGGLDWKRSKWSHTEQRLIKYFERKLLTHAGTVVADNALIQEYIKTEYGRESCLIEYGGDNAIKSPDIEECKQTYGFLGSPYALAVARIQPDNNIEMILKAFEENAAFPLVIVGNWNVSAYGRSLKARYSAAPNIVLLDAIYDRRVLDVIRSNCTIYIHGHSAGGTNPSLVEAMYLGLPIIAFASGFNEETTENSAIYFSNEEDLTSKVSTISELDRDRMGHTLQAIADRRYRWDVISKKYHNLFIK